MVNKSTYQSSWYNGRTFSVIEVPFGEDCKFIEMLFQDRGIHYDYRVNPETGANVFIVFCDNMKEV